MKNKKLFFAIAITFIFTGCVSTPKLVGPPIVVGNSNYKVAQAPVKLDVENRGPQWNQFVRGYNQERLDSNVRLAEIEFRGAEQERAKELGVEYTPQALGQLVPTAPPYPGAYYYPAPSYSPPLYYEPVATYGYPYSYRFGRGSYAYGDTGVWDNVGGGPCGKLFGIRFQQSTPGYRHIGGPATIVNTYSIGAAVEGAGGFTSGLNYVPAR